jgi:hypothetical protein
MVSLLSLSAVNAAPTVIRDSGDTNNFVGIEGLTVDGVYYNVEAVWKSAQVVYGLGEYTFSTEATALQAVEAMNSALNAEGDISGVGYNASGLGGAEAGTAFLIGYDDYDPGFGGGGKQVNAQSGTATDVVWSEEILEKDYDREDWYAEFTAIDPPANLPVLTGLTISEGALDPAFNGETRSYTASVSYETQSMTVTPSAADGTVITVNGDPVNSDEASLPQLLDVGENIIEIALYGDESESTYTIEVTRPAGPPPPMLTALTISSGVLTPTFDGNTLDYMVTVPFETTTMTVTPTSDAAIAVNGVTVTSGNPSPEQILVLGENAIQIVLTAESQTSYSVVVTRMEQRPTGLIVVRDDVETDTAIGIINLVVSNILYDVDFVFGIVPDLYGDPAVYSFTTYGEASAAVDAINSALTEEGGIFNVDTNDNKAIYRIGYVDVAYPCPS